MKSASNDLIIPYLEKYGSHCMAYSSLEPDMQYFVVDGVGYIAYKPFKHWFWSLSGRQIVLADPVCSPDNYKQLLSQFIKVYPDAMFVQISKAVAKALNDLGYEVNQFGIETEISLEDFSLAGKKRAKLRQWQNKCHREEVSFNELSIDDCQNIAEIKALSESWLKSKGGDGLGLLIRPLRFQQEKDTRYFWAYQHDKLVGMALFDPIYRDGKVVAYYHNIDRISAASPHGTGAALLLFAMKQFAKEGVEYVSLGMSPMSLYRGMKGELNYRPFTRKAFLFAYKHLNFLYPFQGNFTHKRKFAGQVKPVYVSSTRGTGLKQIFIMMKAIGMI